MVHTCACKLLWVADQLDTRPYGVSRQKSQPSMKAYVLCKEGAEGVRVALAALCLATVQLGFAAVGRGLLLALCLALPSGA